MSIPANPPECTEVLILFRILTRRDWEALQDWRRACPGAVVEHLHAGLYVLAIPAGGAVAA